MKKLLLVFGALVLALGVFADDKGEARDRIQCRSGLSAPRGGSVDEVAEIKAVLIKAMEMGAQGNFDELLALCTPDYVQVSEQGCLNYEQLKWAIISLDGKHPEEFFLFYCTAGYHNYKLTPELLAQIRNEYMKNPETMDAYRKSVPAMLENFKTDQALQLKTAEFLNFRIDGDVATVLVEFDSIASDAVSHKIGAIVLRKVDGAWKVCKVVAVSK